MTRIVLVGAGSVEFTRNLLGDILSLPRAARRRDRPPRHRPRPAATAERMAAWTAGALGATPTIEAHLDRRDGADRRRLRDQHDPGRRRPGDADRLRHPGPLRARSTRSTTRSTSAASSAACARSRSSSASSATWRSVCPDALFLNYTNPMAMLVRGRRTRRSAFPTVGLCHSVYWTVDRLAGYLGVPAARSTPCPAGVNHLAFLLRLEHRGRDLYPDLRAFVDARPGPRRRPRPGRPVPAVRLSTPRSPRSTTPSTTRGSSPRAEIERFHIPIGEYLTRVANNLDEYDGDEAAARRRRAVRDRAQRRVRGGDRQLRWRPASRPGSWPTS